jgi:hypothetical protein
MDRTFASGLWQEASLKADGRFIMRNHIGQKYLDSYMEIVTAVGLLL